MLSRLIACPLLVVLAACSKDPKSLTDSGAAHVGRGEYKAALADFEDALEQFGSDTSSRDYLRAAIGRCEALARIDPKRAKTEFIALAKAQTGRILEGDFTRIVHGMLQVGTAESRSEAVDLVAAAQEMFPKSPKLDAIAEVVVKEATRVNDPVAIERLKSMGYVGGSK
jgi:hypothetical protein